MTNYCLRTEAILFKIPLHKKFQSAFWNLYLLPTYFFSNLISSDNRSNSRARLPQEEKRLVETRGLLATRTVNFCSCGPQYKRRKWGSFQASINHTCIALPPCSNHTVIHQFDKLKVSSTLLSNFVCLRKVVFTQPQRVSTWFHQNGASIMAVIR